jgi:Family of unknown function (DUF6152)
MNSVKASSLALLILLGTAMPVLAHHGTAGSYDQHKVVTIKGVVKEFRWRNPHSALFLVGKDEAGKDLTYVLEMGSPNVLVNIGFKRNTLKTGDEVVMQMNPSLTNPANGVSLTPRAIMVNGKELKFAVPERAAEDYKP